MAKLPGADLGQQLRAFADKTGEKLEDVDRAFKLGLFNRVVSMTRVADPSTWKRPDPTYLGGTMRGNWQVTTGQPASAFIEGQRNTVAVLPADEGAKIAPFSRTYLTNNTPYVRVWEEVDGMVARGVSDARRQLEKAVRDAQD